MTFDREPDQPIPVGALQPSLRVADLPTVLVVDDDPMIVRLITTCLGSSYRVVSASDGGRVFDLVSRIRPAVVILDFVIPYRTGFDICRQLKAVPATSLTKVVIITAFPTGSIEKQAEEAGADALLRKPFSIAQFIRLIHTLADRYETDTYRLVPTPSLPLDPLPPSRESPPPSDPLAS